MKFLGLVGVLAISATVTASTTGGNPKSGLHKLDHINRIHTVYVYANAAVGHLVQVKADDNEDPPPAAPPLAGGAEVLTDFFSAQFTDSIPSQNTELVDASPSAVDVPITTSPAPVEPTSPAPEPSSAAVVTATTLISPTASNSVPTPSLNQPHSDSGGLAVSTLSAYQSIPAQGGDTAHVKSINIIISDTDLEKYEIILRTGPCNDPKCENCIGGYGNRNPNGASKPGKGVESAVVNIAKDSSTAISDQSQPTSNGSYDGSQSDSPITTSADPAAVPTEMETPPMPDMTSPSEAAPKVSSAARTSSDLATPPFVSGNGAMTSIVPGESLTDPSANIMDSVDYSRGYNDGWSAGEWTAWERASKNPQAGSFTSGDLAKAANQGYIRGYHQGYTDSQHHLEQNPVPPLSGTLRNRKPRKSW